MELQPLSSSHEAYHNAFQTYVAKSTLKEAITNYSREAAAHAIEKITHDVPVFQVLGVGSGSGKPDIEILKAVARSLRLPHDRNQKPSIHTCIVEPSPSLLEEFKQAVSPLPEGLGSLADVSFEWRETTFGDFILGFSPAGKQFHMAHFICSLYYMDAEKSLQDCYKILTSGGAMFCLVTGADSYFARIAKQDKFKCLSVPKFYTGQDIVAIAKRNNWRYEELATTHYEVDITSSFDKSSQTGSFVMDFLSHTVNFRETANPALYSELMEFITDLSTTDSEERRLLKPEIAIVVIYK